MALEVLCPLGGGLESINLKLYLIIRPNKRKKVAVLFHMQVPTLFLIRLEKLIKIHHVTASAGYFSHCTYVEVPRSYRVD